GRLLKGAALKRPLPKGLALPGGAAALLPQDSVGVEEGAAELRRELGRMASGEAMTQRSPMLGRLSPEEWRALTLKHTAHHFSFLSVTDANNAPSASRA
ncbi:MAG: DUF1569 domain-containing protein, partial [Planctomycetota bacterium]|nr:DUF1569 domain-containing protein [Planctomycetota bacterium]